MVLVLHLLRSFLKIFVRTSPGAFDRLKVDVLDLFTSPGAFEILCQIDNPLKIDVEVVEDVEFLLRSFRNFQASWNDLLSLSKMMMQINSHGS